MFGVKLLPHEITIIKYDVVKNEYGEEVKNIKERIKTKAFVNARKTRIVNEKYGIIEDIFYEAIILPDVSVTKENEVEFENSILKIREILPIYDIYGFKIFQKLLMELKK